MLAMVKYTATIQVIPFTMNIDAYGHTATFEPEQSQAFLTTKTEVSEMLSPGNILVISCATCRNSYGQIYFYDIENLSQPIYTHDGDRNNLYMGEVI